MALTRITKGVIKPNENYDTHNINSTGIVTATGANITGNLTVGGVLTYEDVTSIDSVGIITGRGADINGDLDVDGHTNLDNVSVSGISTFSGILDATNTPASIRVAQDIQHKGDADTKISFDTNRINLNTGGINRVSIADTGFVVNDEVYINGNQGIPLRIEGSLGTTENIHIRNYTSGGHIQFGFRQNDSDGHHHRAYITASKGTGSVSGKLELKVRGQGGGTNRGFILDAGVGIQANQRFLPETDSIYDLGSNTLRWQNLFVDDVTVTGVITATKFVGDGSTLTGIDATALKDPAGNVKIQAQSSGAVHTGISTFSHTGANQLVIKDSDTSGDNAHMRISFQDSGGTEKFFVGNNNSNGWLYIGSASGQNNNTVVRVNGQDKIQVNSNGLYVGGYIEILDTILHSGDTDTKIRFPANDTISFETAGSEKLRIESSGNIYSSGLNTFEFNGGWSAEGRNVVVWPCDDAGNWFSFVGTNLRFTDGGNFVKPSDNSNSNWGNIAGVVFEGVNQNNSNGNHPAIRFVVDQPGENGANYSLGSGSSGRTAAIDNNTAAFVSGNGNFITNNKIGVNVSNPSQALHVAGSIINSTSVNSTGDQGIAIGNGHRLGFDQSGTRSWTIKAASGNLNFSSGDGNGVHYFLTDVASSGYVDSASDIKLKTNIKTIDSALDKVLQLRGAEYDRIDKDNKHEIGVIAQEVEKIIPEVVHGEETKSVSYGNIVAVLIEAIKEQNEVINKMKKEIEELKG